MKQLYLLRLGLLSVALWALSTQFALGQATITSSAGGGNWNQNGTWIGGVQPGALDNVIIQSNVTVTTSPTCASLTVNSGTLQMANNATSRTLTVNGDITLNGGTVTSSNNSPNNQINFTGNFTNSGGTYTSSNGTGRINNTLSGTNQTVGGSVATTFNNFIIGSSTTLAGDVTYTGTFTVNAGGSLTGGASTATFHNGITNNGTVTGGSGAFIFDTNSQSLSGLGTYTSIPSITVTGVTLNNNATTLTVDTALEGTGTFVQNTTPSTLNLGGTSGIATLTASTSGVTVNYNGAGPQTINGTSTYYNLGILGSGTKTMQASTTTINGSTTIQSGLLINAAGAKTFSGAVTISSTGSWSDTGNSTSTFQNGITNDGTFSGGTNVYTFDTNAQSLSGTGTYSIPQTTVTGVALTNNSTLSVGTALAGTGTVTQGVNTTLNLGGTVSIAGVTATATGNLVTYNGAAQTIAPGNYYNLTLANSGVKTLSASTSSVAGNLTLSGTASTTTTTGLNIGGNLNIGDGTSFTAAGFNLTVGGQTNVGGGSSGTLSFGSAAGTKIFTGPVTVASGANWTNNTANSNATFRGGLTNVGTFNAGTGVYTFDTNNQAIIGTLSIPNVTVTGVTLTNTSNLTVGTALTGSGALTQALSASLTLGGTSTITTLNATASGNTVTYNGAAQTIHGNDYVNLVLSGTGAKTLQAATANVTGDFTMTGAVSTATVSNLTIGGNLSVGNGTFSAAGSPLTVTGTTNVASGGTLAMTATGSKTFNGLVTISSGGAFTNTANSDVTFHNGITNNGTFAAGASGNYTFDTNAQSLTGTFTLPNATVTGINLTNNNSLSVQTALLGTGTLTQASNATLDIGGTSGISTLDATAAGNTVTYSGAAQTIHSNSYVNLSLTGSGAKTLQAGTTNITGNFTIGGTASATAVAGLTIGGNLTLSGGTFVGGSFTHLLAGNWVNNGGTFTSAGSTINFNGATQSIGGSTGTTFSDVITSGSSSTTTGVATTISGALTVDNTSTFTVGGFPFTVNGATNVGSGSASNLVIASGTGTKVFAGLVTVSPSATWNNSGNSAVTFRGGITNNGTFTAGSGVHTFNTNPQAVTGTLSIPNVTVTGVTLTNNNDLTVSNSLAGTGTLTQAASSNLILGGGATIATLTATASGNEVTYNGSGQNIFATTYEGLNIDQSAGQASLIATTTVNGTLTLTNGNLFIDGSDLLLGDNDVAVTSPSASKMIIASGTGEVRRTVTGTGTYLFPIGDNAGTLEYSPITVTYSSGSFSSAYIGVSVTDAKHPSNASATNYLTRYWNLNQSGISGGSATISATYVPADIVGTEASIKAAHLSGTFDQTSNPWTKFSALAANTLTIGTGINIVAGTTSYCTGIRGADPTVSVPGTPFTICVGGSVALPASVSGGDGTILYSWAPATGLSATSVASPTASPASNQTYTLTIRDGNGIVASTTADVNVSPAPVLSSTLTPSPICSGSTFTYNATSATGGATFAWTRAAVSGISEGASSNSGNVSETLTNTSNVPVAVTYVYITTGPSCSGPAQNVVVYVIPTPAATDPADQVICNGASTAIVTFTGVATSYDWTNDNTSIGLAASGAGNITAFATTNAGNTPQVANIVVTPKYTYNAVTCSGPTQTFTITVQPSPSVNPVGNQDICNGTNTAAINFTGVGSTFSWTNDKPSIGLAANGTGNIAPFTAVNTGAAPVVATIVVTPSAGPCNGSTTSFTITVEPTPTVNAIANQVVCNGTNTTDVIFGGTAGAVFSWTNDNTSIGLAASGNGDITNFTATNTGSTPQTASITVTPSYNSCPGPSKTFTITVNPTPTVVVPSNQSVCDGVNTVAVNFSGTGTSYDWVNDTPSIGLAASGTGNIPSFTATNVTAGAVVATITITPKYLFGAVTCSGTPQAFTITVGEASPTVVDPADQAVCNGGAVAVTFSTTGTGVSWTNDNTAIGLAATGTGDISSFTATNPGTTPLVATITVTPTGPTCSGPTQTFTITVQPTPAVNDPADQVACEGAATSLVHFTGVATAYTWTNDTPAIGLAASGTGDINPFVAVNGTGSPVTATITVTPEYTASCTGGVQTFTILVQPTPTVADPGDQVVCNGDATAGIVFLGVASSYTWTNDTPSIGLPASGTGNIASFTAINSTGAAVVATLTVTPHVGSCNGTPQTFTITVNPTPTVTAPANQVVCNGVNTAAITFAGTASATFDWVNDTPSIGLAASGSGDISAFAAVNAGTTPVTATITVTPSLNTCVGAVKTFTITVNPTPSVTTPASQVVCDGANTTAINFSGTATSYDWVNDTAGIGLAASGTGNIASFAVNNGGGSLPVVATITVTPNYTFGAVTCAGTPKIFTITVQPTPTMNAVTSQVVCNGAATTTVTFGGTATAFSWTNDNTSIGLAGSGTGDITSFNGINTGSSPAVANITVTPVYGSCTGATTSFTITINPTPSVTAPLDQVVCDGANTAAINFAGTGTSYDWVNDTPGIGLAASGTGNIAPFAVNNGGGSVPVVATITITPKYTFGTVTCTGPTKSFKITVQPTPVVTAIGNQEICNGSSTATVSFTGTATSFSWTNDTPSIGLPASGTGDITAFTGVNNGTSPVTATITVTPLYGVCTGTPKTFTIKVNPNPTFTATNNASTICSGTATNISFASTTTGHQINVVSVNYGAVTGGTVTAGTTTFVNGNTLSETLTNATNAPIDVVYTFNVTTPGTTPACPLVPVNQVVTVRVQPTPVFTATNGAAQICSGSNTDITLNTPVTVAQIRLQSVTYGAVSGTLANGAMFTDGQKITEVLTNNTNAAVTVTYVFEAVVGICAPSSTQSVQVVVNPNPSFTVTNNASTICSGTATNIAFASPTTGHQINVVSVNYGAVTGGTVTAGVTTFANGNSLTETLTNTTNAAIDVVYTFNVTTPGTTPSCPLVTANQVVTVRVQPTPVFSITNGASAICSGSNADITLNSTVVGAQIRLQSVTYGAVSGTLAAGATYTDGQKITEVLTNNTNSAVTVTYVFDVVVGSCASSTQSAQIIVNPNPSFTVTNNASTICSGTATNLAFASPTTGHQINVVSVNYGAVTGGTVTAGVTTFANGNSLTETLTNTTNAAIDVVYTFNVTTPGTTPSCPLVTANQVVTVRVQPTPVFSITNGASAICSGSNANITLNSTVVGAQIRLQSVTYGAVSGTLAAGATYTDGQKITEVLTNNTNSPVTVTYVFDVVVGSCASSTQSAQIIVNPNPSFTVTNSAATICSGTATNLAFASPTTGHQINVVSVNYGAVTGGTVTAGVTTFANGNSLTETLTNTTNAAIDVVYTFNVTTPGTTPSCPLVTANQVVTVRVQPTPVFSITNGASAICSGSNANITLNSTVVGAQIRLQSVTYGAVSGTLAAGATYTDGQKITEVLTNNTNSPVTVTYVFDVAVGSCASSTQSAQIIVNPNPSFTVTNNAATICSGTATNLTFASPTTGHQINVVSVNYGAVTGGTVTAGVTTFANGNSLTETLTNTTNAAIDVVYTFNVTTPGTTPSCPLVTANQVVTVRVQPTPVFSITNGASAICSGSNANITLNSTVVGAQIRLQSVTYGAVSGTLAAGATYTDGQKITEVLTNNTNSPVTVTYVFDVVVGSCASSTQSVQVIVNPNPTFTATNNAATICSGTATNIAFASTTTGHQINVASVTYGAVTGGTVTAGTTTFVNGNSLTETLTNATNAPIDVVYVFNVTTPGTTPSCPLATSNQTVTVRVLPTPVFSLVNGAAQICSGSQSNITLNTPVSGAQVRLKTVNYGAVSGTLAAGVLYSDGQQITEVLNNNTNAPVTVVYTFEAIVGSCTPSAIQTTNVIVNPNPSFAATNNATTICSGTATNITFSSPTAGHQINVVSATYGAVTGGTVTPGTTVFTNGTALTETLTNGTNNPIDVVYVFNVTTPGTTPSCPLSTTNQSVTVRVQPTATFTTTNNAPLFCSGGQTNIVLNTPVTNAQIRLASVNYGAASGTLSAGALYTNGQQINEVLTNSTNAAVTVVYTFEALISGCTPSAQQVVNVVVDPIPTLATNLSTQELCEGQLPTISLTNPNNVLGTQYVWTIATTNIAGAANQATPTSAAAINTALSLSSGTIGTITYTVRSVANGCFSAPETIQVTVRQQPVVSVPVNMTQCEPSSIPLNGSIGGGASTALWSVITGAGSLTSTNIVAGSPIAANATYTVNSADIASTVTMRLTTNDPDGPSGLCTAVFADYTITVNRSAKVNAGPDLAQCENLPSIALQGSSAYSPNGTQWTLEAAAGTFSNAASPTSDYSYANPSEAGTTITLRLTAFDPDGLGAGGPCADVFDLMTVKINKLPVVSYVGLPAAMAENEQKVTLTGNQIGGAFSITPLTSVIAPTTQNPTDEVKFDPSIVSLGPNTVTYTYTDGNGCTNTDSQMVLINPVTNIFVFLDDKKATNTGVDIWDVCADQGLVHLIGDPPVSHGQAPETRFEDYYLQATGFNYGDSLKLVKVGTEYYIDTDGAISDTYLIEYIYKNEFNAISRRPVTININASPVAAINVNNSCVKDVIQFNDASTLPNTPFAGVSIDSWNWDFADASFATLQNPPHGYVTPGYYDIVLTTKTNQGCTGVATKQIRVGDVPQIDYSWSALCNNDKTKFKDGSNAGVSTIIAYTWDFGDGTVITGAKGQSVTGSSSTSGTFDNPDHKYAIAKGYDVTLTINTDDGCVNSLIQDVSIFDYITVQPDITQAYFEDFSAAALTTWIPEVPLKEMKDLNRSDSLRSSWIRNIPNGVNIQALDGNAWWTGRRFTTDPFGNNDPRYMNPDSYFKSETSVVNGPCFNLTNLTRPMISLDYWSDAELNRDGAVLQYSVDGGFNWDIVGPDAGLPNRDEGINWYNSQGIVGRPGLQRKAGDYGWSGRTGAWKNARFNLDMIPDTSRDQVRFRIAFGSEDANSGVYDGFAFDNVFVGNKTRNVLVEHFTSADKGSGIADDAINALYDDQVTKRALYGGESDFNDIQYHIASSVSDPLNKDNTVDPGARSVFMSVSAPPTTIMDGLRNNKFTGLFTQITKIEVDRRSLVDPQILLKIDTTTMTTSLTNKPSNAIMPKVTLTAQQAFNTPLLLNIALVEDVGTNRNVLRKLLFGPDGLTITNSIAVGESIVRDKGIIEINAPVLNPYGLTMIAFIQDKNTKEIYQSVIMKVGYKVGSVTVGLEEQPSEEAVITNKINLFPNPASGTFYFGLPASINGDNYKWRMSDQRGVVVRESDFSSMINNEVEVDVSTLANGMYIVIIEGPDKSVAYHKVMVMNHH